MGTSDMLDLTFREWVMLTAAVKVAGDREWRVEDQREFKALEAKLMSAFEAEYGTAD